MNTVADREHEVSAASSWPPPQCDGKPTSVQCNCNSWRGGPSNRRGRAYVIKIVQGKIYNFLERPTGWKCFIYHFTV